MRILHCVHSYPPEAHGGTQEYVAGLALRQREAGHAVAVLAGSRGHSPGGAMRAETVAGVQVFRVVRDLDRERHSGNLGSARVGAAVDAVRQEFAPDLVHVHHWETLTPDLARRAAAAGVPAVVTLHDLFVVCPRLFRMPDHRTLCGAGATAMDCAACVGRELGAPPPVVEALLQQRQREFARELAAAAAVLTVGAAQRDLLAGLPQGPRVPMRALPIGVAAPGALPPPAAPVPGRLRVANWAGFDPRKGLEVLLDAVAGSARAAAFELHLHGRDGEPAYMQELRRRARGLDVTFHGPFRAGEQWTFGSRYDVAVFPFLAFETHGLVVDEALLAGLPVLVSDLGAPPSRLGGRGRAFARGDAPALRQELERLLAEPEERQRLRRAPHGAATLAAHADALQEVYARAVRVRPAAGGAA